MNTRNTSTGSTASVTAFALALVTITAISGLFVAAPAHADYGATPSYNSIDTVCSGRNDPNCIVKETQAAIVQAAPYQYPDPSAAEYNYNTYPTYNYPSYSNYPSYGYSQPTYYSSSYYTPTYTSSYYTPTSYQYSYQYSYQNPSTNNNLYSSWYYPVVTPVSNQNYYASNDYGSSYNNGYSYYNY